jgi:predicted dehydrogenase
MGAMSTRVGLVGYGDAGRGIHAPLITAAGLEVTVVATSAPHRAAQAQQEHPGARVVPDLHALLGLRDQLDLVVLTSATAAHVEQVVACAGAGVPVVSEKPLGVDAASAARAVEAARAAQVPMTVFHNRRWDPEQLTLAALLAAGELGEVFRFERRWERWRPVPKDRWRENAPPAQGGGLVLDLQSHLVDSATHLFGPVTSVLADIAARTTTADDDAFLLLTHRSGVRSHLSALSLAGAPGPRTRVLGTGAAYLVGPYEREPSAFAALAAPEGCTGWLVRGEERDPVPSAPGGHVDFYRAVAAALAAATYEQQQTAMPVQPQEAVDVMAVLDAARASSARQQVVPLG